MFCVKTLFLFLKSNLFFIAILSFTVLLLSVSSGRVAADEQKETECPAVPIPETKKFKKACKNNSACRPAYAAFLTAKRCHTKTHLKFLKKYYEVLSTHWDNDTRRLIKQLHNKYPTEKDSLDDLSYDTDPLKIFLSAFVEVAKQHKAYDESVKTNEETIKDTDGYFAGQISALKTLKEELEKAISASDEIKHNTPSSDLNKLLSDRITLHTNSITKLEGLKNAISKSNFDKLKAITDDITNNQNDLKELNDARVRAKQIETEKDEIARELGAMDSPPSSEENQGQSEEIKEGETIHILGAVYGNDSSVKFACDATAYVRRACELGFGEARICYKTSKLLSEAATCPEAHEFKVMSKVFKRIPKGYCEGSVEINTICKPLNPAPNKTRKLYIRFKCGSRGKPKDVEFRDQTTFSLNCY